MTQMRSCARPAVTPTVVIWLPAAMTKPDALKGEYLTEMGHACPTDHERGLTCQESRLQRPGSMRRRFGISAVCEDVRPPKWHQRLPMIQHGTPPAPLTAIPVIPDEKNQMACITLNSHHRQRLSYRPTSMCAGRSTAARYGTLLFLY